MVILPADPDAAPEPGADASRLGIPDGAPDAHPVSPSDAAPPPPPPDATCLHVVDLSGAEVTGPGRIEIPHGFIEPEPRILVRGSLGVGVSGGTYNEYIDSGEAIVIR